MTHVESNRRPVRALPLVSVIVPVYNGEATLGACLAAIAASDYARYEVIVVDDASGDGSVGVAEPFPCTVLLNASREGAAAARNAGAQSSHGDILFFADADVLVQPDTVSKLVRNLLERPQYVGVFGSYTAETRATNFFSRYRNLLHHFVHQTACEEATTFWAGCGAVWSRAFFAVGGFDAADTSSADVEDIALGYRLTQAGHRIRLAKGIQVTHAKRYNLVGMLRSDVFHRAVPWTRLMVHRRVLRNDLNTRWEHGVSTMLTYAMAGSLCLGALSWPNLLAFPVLLAAFLRLNREIFGLFLKRNGAAFLLASVVTTVLFYFYCGLGLALGLLSLLVDRASVTAPALGTRPRPVRRRFGVK